MNIKREEIVGALARGYCHKETSGKILDSTLIEAMADEIESLLVRESGIHDGPDENEYANE